MITGNKDTDLIVLSKLNHKEFFMFCGKLDFFQNKYINKLSNDESLWRMRLFKYYGEFYPEYGQSWKNLYLSLIYRLDRHDEYIIKDYNSLLCAIRLNHLDVVKYLSGIIDLADKDNFAIQWASLFGNLDIIKYLISLPEKYKINPSAKDNLAIRWASGKGHLNVVKYLISLPEEYNINPSADNNYAIKCATYFERLDMVDYLLSLPEEYGIKIPVKYNTC